MLTVLKHGNRVKVHNPVDGSSTELINVVFAEEGRSGAISSMSGTSDFLNRLTGESVGLDNLRVHTHPIKADKIGLFPLGKKILGHINRKLYSQPQIRQQENVESRMVDGRPTYFTTYLDDTEKEDLDYRMANETLAQVDPEQFRRIRIGAAQVDILEMVNNETQLQQAQAVEQGNPTAAPAAATPANAVTAGTETLGQ
jgi:hypothetical protein